MGGSPPVKNMWTCIETLLVVMTQGGDLHWHLVGSAGAAANHSTMPRAHPHNKQSCSQRVSSAKIGNLKPLRKLKTPMPD